MDLHEIFRIGPQWANRYEVTLNLTKPHLPSFAMTYHIVTVIPSLTISQIKDINREFEHFLNENNPLVVDKTNRYMRRQDLGL